MVVVGSRPARGMPAVALTAAAVFGIATIGVIRFTAPWSTTYSGASGAAEVADLAGGLGLLAAGVLVRLEWPSRTGLLALLAGGSWLARDWVGWQDGPAIARSAAMGAVPFVAPLVLAIVVTFPAGEVGSRRGRLATLVAYAAVGITTAGWLLTDDPRTDPHCWNNCTDNSVLVWARPGVAHSLARAGLAVELGIGLGLIGLCLLRLARATAPARRLIGPIVVPGAVIGGSIAAHAVAVLHQPLEGPELHATAVVFQVTGWSLAALGCGLVWTTVRARRVRSTVARFVSDLGSAPATGSVAAALGAATGDADLELTYWIPERAQFVDAAGRPVRAVEPAGGQALTQIVRGGELVAVARHDATAASAQRLQRAIGPGARLAIDNERLRAGLLAQLADLRDSQARIVAAGDDERRRLERNLHDGAQQALLALSYNLRLARSAAADPGLDELVVAATEKAREALVELRELAHGIYPAILTESGIGPALSTLADTAPIPVHVEVTCPQRFTEQTERAVYVFVAHTVDDASRAGVDHLRVHVTRSQDRLLVAVEGRGLRPSTYLSDRLGAVGGALVGDGDLLRAELPCG